MQPGVSGHVCGMALIDIHGHQQQLRQLQLQKYACLQQLMASVD
jgi:hypothetical protein